MASLDGLPVEIKILVLMATSDMDSLRCLAHSSSGYYQAYLRAKPEILSSMATRELINDGIDLLDPLTAVKAAQLNQCDNDRKKEVEQLLRHFGEADRNCPLDVPLLNINDSIALIRLQNTITSVAQAFCRRAISKNPRSNQLYSYGHLSPTEKLRIHRGLYRWEIYAQLVGYPQAAGWGAADSNKYPARDVLAKLFLHHLPSYEVEELICIYEYAGYEYDKILTQLTPELAPENPRFAECHDSGPQTPPGSFELKDDLADSIPFLTPTNYDLGMFEDDYRDSLISLGPALLFKVLGARKEDVEPLIVPYLHVIVDQLSEFLYENRFDPDMEEKPASMSQGKDYQPNPGWLWGCQNDPQHLYYLQHQGWVLWGYVMWDAKRFEDWGITKENMFDTGKSYIPAIPELL